MLHKNYNVQCGLHRFIMFVQMLFIVL